MGTRSIQGFLVCAVVVAGVFAGRGALAQNAGETKFVEGWGDAGIVWRDQAEREKPIDYRHFIEWAGVNLGGGYIANSNSFGKIDINLFTISRAKWFYTVLEAGIFPFVGQAGVGGRAGYQHFINDSLVIRAGGKFGFVFWGESLNGDDYDHYGIEITPGVQVVKFFRHVSVGGGLDIPIYFSAIVSEDWDYGYYNDPHTVAGGFALYFRLGFY